MDCSSPTRKRMSQGDQLKGLRCTPRYTVPVDTTQVSSVNLCPYAFNLTRQSNLRNKLRVYGEASDATQHSLSVPWSVPY